MSHIYIHIYIIICHTHIYIYIHNYTYTHIYIYIYAQEFHKPRSRFFRLWNLLRDSGLKIGVAKILAHHSFSTETRMHRILHFSSEWLSKPMPYSSIRPEIDVHHSCKSCDRCLFSQFETGMIWPPTPLVVFRWKALPWGLALWDRQPAYRSPWCFSSGPQRVVVGCCLQVICSDSFMHVFLARIVPDCLFFWQFVRHLDALFEAGYFGGHMCIEPSMAYRGGSGPPVHHQSRQSLHHPHWALPPNPSLKLGSCWWESVLGPDIYGSQYMLRWLVPPANSNSCN